MFVYFINQEVCCTQWFWIILIIGFILSLVLDYIKVKRKLKKADELNHYLNKTLVEKKERICEIIAENDIQREQIRILEEEADGVSEVKYGKEVVKISSQFKGKRVLVADYYEPSFKKIRKNLRRFGLYVDVVRDGKDVIAKIKGGYKYDLIITNNVFKDRTSGPKVLSTLKCIQGFNTPVVIHTVSYNKRTEFLSMGFDDYLEKQASIEELDRVLKKLFKRRKNEGKNK